MSQNTSSLAEALAAVQAELPEVRKGETAKVPTKTGGSYSYTYADLAAVSRAILPRLGSVGLSWITKPTIIDGQFVLAYKLLHISGEADEGIYPLPERGSPQEIGSAITYARRYALCSVTGVAPADDDDAAEATAGHKRDQQMSRSRDSDWESARPARQTPPPDSASARPAAPSKRSGELARMIQEARDKDPLAAAWSEINAAGSSGDITPAEAAALKSQWTARKDRIAAGKRMYALLGQAELTDRDAKLAYVSDVTGREVASTNDLTDDELRLVCKRLESFIAQSTPPQGAEPVGATT